MKKWQITKKLSATLKIGKDFITKSENQRKQFSIKDLR